MNVTADCDCIGKSPKIFGDLGVLASRDPVAIDQASLDLIRARHGCRLEERSYPEHDASVQLAHAEAVGLGRREHEIVEVRGTAGAVIGERQSAACSKSAVGASWKGTSVPWPAPKAGSSG